jgi:hypothetical protein
MSEIFGLPLIVWAERKFRLIHVRQIVAVHPAEDSECNEGIRLRDVCSSTGRRAICRSLDNRKTLHRVRNLRRPSMKSRIRSLVYRNASVAAAIAPAESAITIQNM